MTGTESKRIRLGITGVVQGVYYRASARERAQALELTGWVRNTPDGAVELEAQGTRSALEALIAWCRQGPPGARVEQVDVEWITPHEADENFRIRY